MDLSGNRFYVYTHKDPRSGVVRYVGMGSRNRAWSFLGVRRYPEHEDWYREMEYYGCAIDQIVDIVSNCLTQSEARRVEEEVISQYPSEQLFNWKGVEGDRYAKPESKWSAPSRRPKFEYSVEDVEDFMMQRKKSASHDSIPDILRLRSQWKELREIEEITEISLCTVGRICQQFETFLQLRNSSQ